MPPLPMRDCASGSDPQSAHAGLESGSFDARDGADFVIVRTVAADTNRAEQRAAAILDQYATWHRHQCAARPRIHCADEIRLLLGALEQRPRSHAGGQSTVGLAVSDLAAQQAGAVLGGKRLDAAARIEHGDDERLQFLLDTFRQSHVEDLACNVESEISHGVVPLYCK